MQRMNTPRLSLAGVRSWEQGRRMAPPDIANCVRLLNHITGTE